MIPGPRHLSTRPGPLQLLPSLPELPLLLPPCMLQLLWGEGGVRRFYRGFTPCLMRAMPANGVMLLTVDTVTGMLNKP